MTAGSTKEVEILRSPFPLTALTVTTPPPGYLDYAGSGVVHLCGAVCAAMGAWLMGARAGRFRAGEAVSGWSHGTCDM